MGKKEDNTPSNPCRYPGIPGNGLLVVIGMGKG
jgi:hypothetical protein